MKLQTKLVCIPYSGGGAWSYSNWRNELAPSVELVPIELAGRGLKSDREFHVTIPEAIESLIDELQNLQLFGAAYALFGHSLGGLLAFELCHRIKEKGLVLPNHIFISGAAAPEFRSKNKLHLVTDEELVEEIIAMGGTSREVFSEPELRDLFLPIFRADFLLSNSYVFRESREKLAINASIFCGDEEKFEPEEWRKHFAGACSVSRFAGGHFFINEHLRKITHHINQALR